MKLEYIVDENKYTTIKQVLKSKFDMSNRLILKLKRAGQIYLNGQVVNINCGIVLEDKIEVNLSFEEESENIAPTKMDLDILYEDEWILVISKAPHTPVHPSLNHFEDSLSNGVKYYFDSVGLKRKTRPVNRLDKDTSGIVIFAKSEYIQECLIKQMKTNTFEKEYLALVTGCVTNKLKRVVAPIARKTTSIIERCVSEDGDYAETIIELLQPYSDYSLVKCTLKTGRTHQIRVHTNYISHPILGDTLYGSSSNLISRQALHAYKVKFIHPISKEKIEIISNLPSDMASLIDNFQI